MFLNWKDDEHQAVATGEGRRGTENRAHHLVDSDRFRLREYLPIGMKVKAK